MEYFQSLSTGVLRFSKSEKKLWIQVCEDFSAYYSQFIPKSIKKNRPRFPPHISVVRNEEFNVSSILENVDQEVSFYYDTNIQIGDVYIWMNVISKDLKEIRKKLCLNEHSEFTRPPDGSEFFHITIANRKEK